MILDTLANAARYESLHPRFADAFAYLRSFDGSEALGKHEIQGEDCFAIVQTYETKPLEKAKFEAHRRYIDIQFLFQGRETLLWAPLSTMKEVILPYSEEKEAALWTLTTDYTPVHLTAGSFCILYPEDAHAPCVEWGAAEHVLKIVVKVAVV